MVGGAGNDTYYVNDATNDLVYDNKFGEASALGSSTADLVVSTVNWTLDTTEMADIDRLHLTSLAVIGTSGANQLYGLGGDDTIEAGSGNDLLEGGFGDDSLNGQNGNDTLHGDDGADTLFGDLNDDVLYGGDGQDELWGGGGNDTLEGQNDNDLIYAEQGNDRLFGQAGDDTLDVGDGDDLTEGATGEDSLLGGGGHDTLDGGDGIDSMDGGTGGDLFKVDSEFDRVAEAAASGNDTVQAQVSYVLTSGAEIERLVADPSGATSQFNRQGNAFGQRIIGANDEDTLEGRGGADTLNGGGGVDVVHYLNSAVGVSIDLTLAVQIGGEAAGDVFIDIEAFHGSNSADTLRGAANNDILWGLDGNDSLVGRAGDDWLLGSFGDDTLDGGSNGFAGDRLDGGQGNDVYFVDSAQDTSDEVSGNGYGHVISTVSLNYDLGIGMEKLTLVSATGLSGRGNAGNTLIIGSARNTSSTVAEAAIRWRVALGTTPISSTAAMTW